MPHLKAQPQLIHANINHEGVVLPALLILFWLLVIQTCMRKVSIFKHYLIFQHSRIIELLGLAKKNTRYLITSGFQITKIFLVYVSPKYCMRHAYPKKLFGVHLKIRFAKGIFICHSLHRNQT